MQGRLDEAGARGPGVCLVFAWRRLAAFTAVGRRGAHTGVRRRRL